MLLARRYFPVQLSSFARNRFDRRIHLIRNQVYRRLRIRSFIASNGTDARRAIFQGAMGRARVTRSRGVRSTAVKSAFLLLLPVIK